MPLTNKHSSKGESKAIIKQVIKESSRNPSKKTRKLNHYEIGKVLGKGSYAVVHIAHDTRDGKDYALKTYDKSKIYNKTRRTIVEREI